MIQNRTITLQWEDGPEGVFQAGIQAGDALAQLGIPSSGQAAGNAAELAAVLVNNGMQSLAAPVEVNARVKPVPFSTHEGRVVYRSTLAFLLAAAAARVFPDKRLIVGHSLGNGYYYYLTEKTSAATPASVDDETDEAETEGREPSAVSPPPEALARLKAELAALVKADLSINFYYMAYEEAAARFEANGQTDTVRLLAGRVSPRVPVYECGGWIDLAVGVLAAKTGAITVFDIHPYEDGFLLRYPTSATGGAIGAFEDAPKLFAVYREYKQWGRIVHLHSAGELNRLIAEGGVKEFVRVAEAFHAVKLSRAAEQVYNLRGRVQALLIAGPSSSGKTTTSKRIAVQLRALGLEPLAVSLDDYYNSPSLAPKDEYGKPDLESLDALDVPFLNEQLTALLDGREVTLPVFDFKTGSRRAGRTVKAGRRTIVILEGIHGLNDRLTGSIPAEKKWKLYVSPLTQLNLDDHNRVPTSDNRLLRRIVRDHQFRGVGASKTIAMWSSVRRGELRNIFPFQEGADFVFNSALDYELSVLKVYAEPLLRSVPPCEEAFTEAVRLLTFLENFTPILPQIVPDESILREFIGGSDFKY